MLPPTRTLAHILNDMGYQQIENRRLKIQKQAIITISAQEPATIQAKM